jgi:hypothetical protein
MSECDHLDARDAARAAVARLAGYPEVLGTDLIAPDVDATGCWTVEITIDDTVVPRKVMEILSDEGLSMWESGRRGDWTTAIAVA